MKRLSNLFVVFILFSFLLWNGCTKDETPALPTITSFTPTSGVEATTITISGTNFSTTPSSNAVTFNGTVTTVIAATTTQITTTVPTGATTGKIGITVNGKTVTSDTDFMVEAKGPSITNFTPTSGLAGITVTITGTNFSTIAVENIVKINDTSVTVIAATATQLTIIIPASAITGKITITVAGKTSTSSSDFMVIIPCTITGFTPVNGAVGSTVTITGTNFSTSLNENSVKFNGVVASVTAATATSLTVIVPVGASTGKISVQVGTQTATSTDDFTPGLPVTVSTLAGSTSGFADGTGSAAQFKSPYGVAVDASGNIYVADQNNQSIRKITPDGVVSTLAGGVGEFSSPSGVAVDASGNVYVADTFNNRIRKITPDGVVSTLAGEGTPGFADGTGSTARFKSPYGLAADASGNIYVADTFNHRIRKITPDGVVSTLAGSGTAGSADGSGTAARFSYPDGVAVDASGNVYIGDDNHRIRKITPGGEVSAFAGSIANGFVDGAGSAAKFSSPAGIAVDASGNVYVADEGNNRIRVITPGGVVSTLAGSGVNGFVDGTGITAQFNYPKGVAVDASGNVYVADPSNNRIRKIHHQ